MLLSVASYQWLSSGACAELCARESRLVAAKSKCAQHRLLASSKALASEQDFAANSLRSHSAEPITPQEWIEHRPMAEQVARAGRSNAKHLSQEIGEALRERRWSEASTYLACTVSAPQGRCGGRPPPVGWV